MAPRSKSKKKGKKIEKKQRKHKEDISVVKLVTRGKVSGQFSQRSFGKLSPLVRIPLNHIGPGLRRAGHVFLGFTKSGRYILSYTRTDSTPMGDSSEYESDPEDPPTGGAGYTLYWWEFNLHSKLKLVQQVKLFADGREDPEKEEQLDLHVCEWPDDDSSIVIFGFDVPVISTDQLMRTLQSASRPWAWCNWYVTIAPNPPSKPCSHCSAMNTTHTGSRAKCLEHGYAIHGEYEENSPFPFQPALQLKKNKVVLLKQVRLLVACAIYLCPAGEQGQSSQMLYTKRSAPPTDQPSSSHSTLPQGTPASSSDSSPTLSSSQEANHGWIHTDSGSAGSCWIHGYVEYRRPRYYPPQPATVGGHVKHPFYYTLVATDLDGRDQEVFRPGGPHGGPSLCVEEMELDVGRLLSVLLRDDAVWDARNYSFDYFLLEVCPDTDNVLIAIGLFWECEECHMKVSWDLGTGLCSVIGVSDHLTADVPYNQKDSVKSHRKSCVHTVMECSVPESSSHRINVIDDLPKRVFADSERCTWVTTRRPS